MLEIMCTYDHRNSSLIPLPCPSLVLCCLYLSLSFLSLLSVSPPPILPSCSSYFSLLPGARRSVPDGNSLRLQEPPRRPHGGGTGGEQSGPVLPSYPSLPMYFFFSPFHPFLFSSFSLTLVSSLPRLPLSPLQPACQATQVLRVTCSWLSSLSTEPSPFLLHPPPPPSTPDNSSSSCSCPLSTLLLPPPGLSRGGRR